MEKKSTFIGNTIFLLLVFSLLLMGQIAHAAEFRLRVKISDAEIRLKPNKESTLISKAPLGTILKSQEKIGEWYKVDLPPDEQGVIISGYIHQNDVDVSKEIEEPPKQEIVREEPEPRVEGTGQPTKEEKKKKFSFRAGLGVAFPTGDWSDLFNLGLGAMVGNSFSLVQQQMFDLALVGSFGGYIFLRKSGYTDISWTRIFLSGDIRLSLKANQFSIFGQGGAGIYLDILEISDWLWGKAEDSEFRFGPRIGGGIEIGSIEILGLYHLAEDKMFTLMLVATLRF
ncbi:MAG: hypothetical protein ACFFCQ_16870 [Promethearchaeota archaeon]